MKVNVAGIRRQRRIGGLERRFDNETPVVLELGLHVLQPLVQALQPVQDAVQRLPEAAAVAANAI